VFSGANCSLVGGRISAPHYHGDDGLGDVLGPYRAEGETQTEHAVQALIRVVNENIGNRIDFHTSYYYSNSSISLPLASVVV